MRVVTISGSARHGKDTTAQMMKDYLLAVGYKVLITHYADLLKYICKEFFGWNGQKDDKGRTLLQYVGTDIVRSKAPNYWVDFIISILNLFNDEWDFVLIPDVRFPNEVDLLKEAGFETVSLRVIRDEFDNGLTESQKKHPSETAFLLIKPDFYIYNNGTLEDLREEIERLIKENVII